MAPSNYVRFVWQSRDGVIAVVPRLLAAVMFLCVIALSPALGQTATYSDSWFVDNSGAYYDAEEDAWVVPESPAGESQVAGCGVTEPAYTDSSESVETTLTSPDGRTVSATTYVQPWYSRAEVTLPWTDVEGDYSVQTVHTYRSSEGCTDPRMDCYIARASYNPASPQYFSFYRVVTFFVITIRVADSHYEWYSVGSRFCRYRPGSCVGRCTQRSVLKVPPGGGCDMWLQCRQLYVVTIYGGFCTPGICVPWGPVGRCS